MFYLGWCGIHIRKWAGLSMVWTDKHSSVHISLCFLCCSVFFPPVVLWFHGVWSEAGTAVSDRDSLCCSVGGVGLWEPRLQVPALYPPAPWARYFFCCDKTLDIVTRLILWEDIYTVSYGVGGSSVVVSCSQRLHLDQEWIENAWLEEGLTDPQGHDPSDSFPSAKPHLLMVPQVFRAEPLARDPSVQTLEPVGKTKD